MNKQCPFGKGLPRLASVIDVKDDDVEGYDRFNHPVATLNVCIHKHCMAWEELTGKCRIVENIVVCESVSRARS